MNNEKKVKIFPEGYLDKNCLEEIYKRIHKIKDDDFKDLKRNIDDPFSDFIKDKDKFNGKESVLGLSMPSIRRMCLIVDLNGEKDIESIINEANSEERKSNPEKVINIKTFIKEKKREGYSLNKDLGISYPFPTLVFEKDDYKICLICFGLPKEEIINKYKVESYIFEDHLLFSLCNLKEENYSHIEKKLELRNKIEASLNKLVEVITLSRKQGIDIKDSKQIIQLFHGIVGYKLTTGRFYSDLIKHFPEDIFDTNFAPLINNIENVFNIKDLYS